MASLNVSTQKFDYIVIGSGTAGTALAARLSEDPDIVVGVIEAGEHVTDIPAVAAPGMVGTLTGNERIDWNFKSVPQPHADNRQISLPRGKAVGGSSAINYMAWGRPTREEYDAIEALGNPGWGWKDLLPYMMKTEGMIQPPEDLAKIYHTGGYTNDWHGQTGPIKKSFAHWYNDLHVPFLESMVRLGVPLNINSGNGINYGSFTGAFSVDPETATRCYAATGYYEPNVGRKNLVLISQAQATRIILEPAEDGELVATGIEYIKDEQKTVVKASREVIVSAGAYQTPQILELSGIGKRDVLNKYGIKQLLDLNVGENLQDHPWVPYIFDVSTEHETFESLADPEFFKKQLQLYQGKQRGMFSSMFSAFSFVSLEKAYESKDKYDAFKRGLAADTSPGKNAAEKDEFGFIKKWLSESDRSHLELIQVPGSFSKNKKPQPGTHYNTLMLGILQPLSRGSVHLASADPLAPPAIDLAFLAHPLDMEMMLAGIRFCHRIMAMPPYSDAVRARVDPPPELTTDAQLERWVRGNVGAFYHPMGTAAMLPRSGGGVVDSSLKVYGTKNLRVVDASVLPLIISAHPQATVYAIAEKAADIIKAARKLS